MTKIQQWYRKPLNDVEPNTMVVMTGSTVGPLRTYFYKPHLLEDYPWLKSIEHLDRVNRYRKRVDQDQILLSEDDLADLILLG